MLLQAVASGIVLGLVYAGLAVGLSIIMATGRLTNLSHGEARSSVPLCLPSSAGCPSGR
jgi:branched-subunit amino acid ABC-type transport system permease component